MGLLRFLRLLNTILRDREPDLAFIEKSGLLAIKLGQMFALRPDFLGDQRCRILSNLYRHVGSIPAEDALRLIEGYAGKDYLSHFASFQAEPFASASVGQVHRGVLKDGTQVAVKIIKRDAAADFQRDVERLKRLLRLAIAFYPALRGVANPVSLLEQVQTMTTRELDLRNEVEGWRTLCELKRKSEGTFDLERMQFGHVYEALSGEKILVSDFVGAPTLDELLERNALNYETLLELFRLHGYFLFSVGTFHGDIHPGNILFRDGVFTFIDTGYLGRVTQKMRIALLNFFDALSRDAYGECAARLNDMADRGIEGQAYAHFERRFLDLYADFGGKTVSEVSLTQKMMDTIRLGVLSGMHFDEGMFDIIKSLMFLDGMVIRANPRAVLLKDMRRFMHELSPA